MTTVCYSICYTLKCAAWECILCFSETQTISYSSHPHVFSFSLTLLIVLVRLILPLSTRVSLTFKTNTCTFIQFIYSVGMQIYSSITNLKYIAVKILVSFLLSNSAVNGRNAFLQKRKLTVKRQLWWNSDHLQMNLFSLFTSDYGILHTWDFA